MNCTPRNFLKNHWGENRSVRTGFNADESALFWGICHKVHRLVKKGSELQDLWQKEATSMILCKCCQVFVQMIMTPLTSRAANPEPSREMINTICQSFGCTTRRPDNRNLCWVGVISASSLNSGSTLGVIDCLLKFFWYWTMPLATQNPMSSTLKASKCLLSPKHNISKSAYRSEGQRDL